MTRETLLWSKNLRSRRVVSSGERTPGRKNHLKKNGHQARDLFPMTRKKRGDRLHPHASKDYDCFYQMVYSGNRHVLCEEIGTGWVWGRF